MKLIQLSSLPRKNLHLMEQTKIQLVMTQCDKLCYINKEEMFGNTGLRFNLVWTKLQFSEECDT